MEKELGGLPEGWVLAQISDVSIKGTQRVPEDSEEFDYVDIGSINRDLKSIESPQFVLGKNAPSRARKEIYEGDILVSLTRPNLNAVAIVPGKYHGQIASTGFEVIRPCISDSRYIFGLTRSRHFIDEISGAVQGALYPAAKSVDVQNYRFPLAPLAEQKIIAEKLDSLLAQVHSIKTRLDQIPQILKRFRQAVLDEAISGKLTTAWRKEKKSSKDWRCCNISDLAKKEKYSLSIGPFGSNLKVSDYRLKGSPLVFVRDIRAESFGSEKTKFIDKDKFEELYAHHVAPGDILITKMGDPPGDVAIYPMDRPIAVITADCIKLSVNESLSYTKFIYYAMKSNFFTEQVLNIAAGVAQQKVNLANFRKIVLRLPPLEEQTEIVARVEKLFAWADNIEKQVNAAQQRVNNLTQSILAKAFRGELTEQWRKDHPELISGENSAAALLEKIKAERAAQTKKSKKKA
jgi:type I restriction enzyme S subunit